MKKINITTLNKILITTRCKAKKCDNGYLINTIGWKVKNKDEIMSDVRLSLTENGLEHSSHPYGLN